jgi:FAD-linked oxidoreductase
MIAVQRRAMEHAMQPPHLTRRHLLQQSAIALLGAGILGNRAGAQARGWNNWSGNQSATPADILYPGDEAELCRMLAGADAPVRAFGGSHSFTPLVPTTGTLISLERMAGLIGHDAATQQATYGAGTRIGLASQLAAGIGQNLRNEPDINLQSLAGAIATATHGTGATLQSLSGYVRALKLVLADGSVVSCSAQQDRELFDAARVSLGALGIITEITLQNRPAYRLAAETQVMDIAAACDLLTARRDLDRHIECFVFPYGDTAIVKRMNITTDAITPPTEPSIDEDAVLEFAAETVRRLPFTQGLLQRLVAAFVPHSNSVGPAERIFPSPRLLRFNEMEYTVPMERGMECLEELIAVMRGLDIGVFFPLEFRYIAADDTALGMCSERAGAAISVHQYHRQDYHELFAALEPVLRKYQGRPHWGKLHTLQAAELRELYPRWETFLAVRRRVDPHARFLNPYASTLLGVPA